MQRSNIAMHYLPQSLRVAVGILLTALTSFGAAHLFAGTKVSTLLPVAFIAVLFLLARLCGMPAAVLASLLCTFIFARCMFAPAGDWHVENLAARQSLLWMVVGTIAMSLLFDRSEREKRS
jgi:K+-sensing histidine kinase KdpD